MDGCITKFSACWFLAFKESVELKNKIMHREETFKNNGTIRRRTLLKNSIRNITLPIFNMQMNNSLHVLINFD